MDWVPFWRQYYHKHFESTMDAPSSAQVSEAPQQKDKGIWNQLIQTLVRPPKHTYSKAILGPQRFTFYNKTFRRLDININHQGSNLELSLFEPEHCLKIVILYLHGNSSCRIEAFSLIEYLPEGYSLACFDFLGCGNSKEEFISLGVRESQQIATVVSYLETNGFEVILWGRSMGAASCLKYGGSNIMVVDSPFSSLRNVCKDTAQQKKPGYVPDCIVSCLFPCVYQKLRSDVKETADFDMNQLDIIKSVQKMDNKKTIIFLSGLNDTLIDCKHSQKLYKAFKGENKKIFLFQGTHNSKRPKEVMESVFSYITLRTHTKKTEATENLVLAAPEIELMEMSHQCRRDTEVPSPYTL